MTQVKLRLLRSGADIAPDLGELMARSGKGDEAAFGLLYDELSALVYGVVLRVVRNPAIAEEVAQEAFVEIWRVATRFDPNQGSVKGWASTIAHRKAVDRVRSEQSRTNREETEHAKAERPAIDEVVELITRAEDRVEVQQALDQLTSAQREAVELAYFGGHTYREVAVLLNTPEGTIKTRIRDGLIKLRDHLGGVQ